MFRIHEFFLTFFYLGKIKKAPGTFGSLGSVILWFVATKYFINHQISFLWQNIFWILFLNVIIFYSLCAIPSYVKKLGEIDHKTIVIDELVGQILALQISFLFIHNGYFLQETIALHLFLSFILFRFFDIKKPSLIGIFDRKLKTAFGVILDDILAGTIAGVLTAVLLTLLKA